jgi:glycosyltransferase involved in cell wall biosynthesis
MDRLDRREAMHDNPRGSPVHSELVFFGHREWADLEQIGFRKTSGAMFRCLRDSGKFGATRYVQMDRRWGFRVDLRKVDLGCHVIGLPVGAPFGRFAPLRRANRILQASLLRRALRRLGSVAGEAVVWFYDWAPIEIVSRVPRARTVMEVTDAPELVFASLPAALRAFPRYRAMTMTGADLIIAVAPRLADGLRAAHGRVVVLPNGVAGEFLAAALRDWPEPQALTRVGHPRLCVVAGEWSINHRVDHEFLRAVMQRLPGWSLVLIGVGRDRSPSLIRLLESEQVVAVPLLPHAYLVAYLKHCDVCAIPYVPPGGLRDALKTYEYLACGRPVIVTVEVVDPLLAPLVVRAESPAEFVQGCVELAARGGRDLASAHRALAGFTWELRAERALALLDESKSGSRAGNLEGPTT